MNVFYSILSGLFLGFSFPFAYEDLVILNLGFLAYFAYIPLLYLFHKNSWQNILRYSFLSHLISFGISMYWIFVALHSYSGLHWSLCFVLYLLLISILAFYLSLAFVLAKWIAKRLSWNVYALLPFCYLAIEFLRNQFPFGGFPWNQIAYTQGAYLYLIQSLDLFGPYFLCLMILFINVGLMQVFRNKKELNLSNYRILYFALFIFLSNAVYGFWRFNTLDTFKKESEIKVSIVQPNISQDEKWLAGKEEEVIEILARLNGAAESLGAELILWPEAAFPYIVAHDTQYLRFDLGLKKASVFAGAVTLSLEEYMKIKTVKSKNSALIVDDRGEIKSVYHKVHLVPFGEYVPLKNIFFFINKIVQVEGELLPGEEAKPIQYKAWLFAPLICFEDLFPEISREMVKKGAHALFNLTNDGWYNKSSAAYQHLWISQYRAIETRRDLLRATNTGISAHIDYRGKLLWQRQWFVSDIYLSHLALRNGQSFYVQTGDLLAWLVLLGVLTLFGLSFLKKGFKNESS